MKVITLKDIEWVGTDQFHTPAQTLKWYGKKRQVKQIVIHWWNSPAKAGTLDATVNYLKRAKDTSIHFVVSGDRVIQMVNMNNTAWHASNCNPVSVGIEVDPKLRGNTYETTGALVKFIRGYYKNIPLVPHNRCAKTTCPGTVSLKTIDQYAKGIAPKPSKPAPKPAPKPTPSPKPAPVLPAKEHKGGQVDISTLNKLIVAALSLVEWLNNLIRRK